MTSYFLDSSAAIKRYLNEIGTAWVQTITAIDSENVIYVAYIARVEVVSGATRQRREGMLTLEAVRAVRALVDQHTVHEYNVVELAKQVIERAEDLLETYPLRAYDAIQLASARKPMRV